MNAVAYELVERLAASDIAPSTDGAWVDIDELLRLEARPAWLDCLRAQNPLGFDGPPATLLSTTANATP